MTTIINVTPHAININNGDVFAPSGIVARVDVNFDWDDSGNACTDPIGQRQQGCDVMSQNGWCDASCRDRKDINGIPVYTQKFGKVISLPAPADNTVYIVSGLVLDAAKASGRSDCVAPATGHKDTIRNDKGHIVSVPGFVS